MPTISISQFGPIAFAKSVILKDGILGMKISPPHAVSSACRTISTPSTSEILNRVILGSVIGKTPSFLFLIKKGITDPLDPITLPYRTTENFMSLNPFILFAAIKSLSEVNLVAPYKFIGAQALYVERATTFFTFVSKQALITFYAPPIFVFTHSSGLYSAM